MPIFRSRFPVKKTHYKRHLLKVNRRAADDVIHFLFSCQSILSLRPRIVTNGLVCPLVRPYVRYPLQNTWRDASYQSKPTQACTQNVNQFIINVGRPSKTLRFRSHYLTPSVLLCWLSIILNFNTFQKKSFSWSRLISPIEVSKVSYDLRVSGSKIRRALFPEFEH